MSKTILYLNDSYCQTVSQFRDLLSNPQLVKTDSFRQEILSLYKDGVLTQWLKDRDVNLKAKDSTTDDVLFSSLYKEIVGNNECPNFHSDFSKLGEFLRCEIDNKQYSIENGIIKIDYIANQEQTVRFVFKSLKADNNIREFSIRNKEKELFGIEVNWSDKSKGKEFYFELPINPSLYQGDMLSLVEGGNNLLSSISFNFPFSTQINFAGMKRDFYYVQSLKCWIVKMNDDVRFSSIKKGLKGYEKYKIELLSYSDVEEIKKEKVYDFLMYRPFFLKDGRVFWGKLKMNDFFEVYTNGRSK